MLQRDWVLLEGCNLFGSRRKSIQIKRQSPQQRITPTGAASCRFCFFRRCITKASTGCTSAIGGGTRPAFQTPSAFPHSTFANPLLHDLNFIGRQRLPMRITRRHQQIGVCRNDPFNRSHWHPDSPVLQPRVRHDSPSLRHADQVVIRPGDSMHPDREQ